MKTCRLFPLPLRERVRERGSRGTALPPTRFCQGKISLPHKGRGIWALLLLIAFPVFAQVRSSSFAEYELSPGPQIAGGQDSWSLLHNPAGLAFVDGQELVGGYVYNWGNPDGLHQSQFVLGLGLFEGFSLALGMQLGFPKDETPGDKGYLNGQLGMAYRFGRTLSIGAWTQFQRRYVQDSSDPFIFGFGLQYYPLEWLSFGALAKQVYGSFASPPEWQVGVAIRPMGDEFSIFSETRFWPKADNWSPGYDFNFIAGLRFDLSEGSIFAQSVIQKEPLFMVGIDMAFDNFGLGLLGGNSYAGGRFKLSSENSGSIVPASKRWVQVEIDSSGNLRQEFRTLTAKLFGKRISQLSFLNSLDELAHDKSVEGVVVHLDSLTVGWGRGEELRSSFLAMKNSGKQVVVYLNETGAVDYYIASAGTKIVMNPGAAIKLDEFRRTLVYLRDGLDKLGVEPQAIVAGQYKSAPRMFTANKPNAEELEVAQAILDQRYETFCGVLANKTGKSLEAIKAEVNLGMITAQEALGFGLVDEISEPQKLVENQKSFYPYFGVRRKITQWGALDQIAVIPISGTIIAGHAKSNIFFPKNQTGAEDVVEAIRFAEKNPHVKGVLLRVDSPGGDSYGSEQIYQALRSLRSKKPVVTSMGDIAASGGYFAAAGTQEIWAEPLTLTGSIGVFYLQFSGAKLAEKLGVHTTELKKGQLPGASLFRPLTSAELERGQKLVDWTYTRFKQSVADGQGLAFNEVSKLAEGRVWTGEQAHERKLVQKLGGFQQALTRLKELARIRDGKRVQLAIYQPSSNFSFDFNLNPLAHLQGKTLALMPWQFSEGV